MTSPYAPNLQIPARLQTWRYNEVLQFLSDGSNLEIGCTVILRRWPILFGWYITVFETG